MTRPKVGPEKRQRTAQACDSCKKRKQKCDGQVPCATCDKRKFECTYHTSDPDAHYVSSPGDQSSPKRARSSTGIPFPDKDRTQSIPNYGIEVTPGNSLLREDLANNSDTFQTQERPQEKLQNAQVPEFRSRSSLDGDEEADNHTMARMLEDETGRLLYVGDASTLSFLQLLRMIVETAAGPCAFSLDPQRHYIVENQLDPSLERGLTYRLPNRETALILVESFFTNSYGMLEIFDEKSFLGEVEQCYTHPLSMDRTWLCLFFLVLAIGLCFATPFPNTKEAEIVDDLRNKDSDQSEIFYLNAKNLHDPMMGLEDSDFWSIRALTLMAVYMLARSMRNRAFAYVGMAVRSGYSLGLHSEEALVMFSPDIQVARRMLWRTLFILDRFLAASLGRPLAITEDESLGAILNASNPSSISRTGKSDLSPKQTCAAGTAAAVGSGQVVAIILRKVYRKGKISTRLAEELADQCVRWPQSLSPALHWRQASPKNIRQSMAILHTNLVYCHSIILLARPFFLYLLSIEIQQTRLAPTSSDPQDEWAQKFEQKSPKIKKFSDACVIASNHTVALVQMAYDGGYLPRKNPLATYSLFTAALVIFANSFARPSKDALPARCIANSIAILEYSGGTDPAAQRNASILRDFRDVLRTQGVTGAATSLQAQLPLHVQSPPLVHSNLQHLTPLTSGESLPALPSATLPSGILSATALADSDTSAAFGLQPMDFGASGDDLFSGLLDLENTVLPVTAGAGGEDISGSEEAIDFDALWQWPTGGSPLPTVDDGNLTMGD